MRQTRLAAKYLTAPIDLHGAPQKAEKDQEDDAPEHIKLNPAQA